MSTDNRKTLELFVERVAELGQLRLIRDGKFKRISFNIKWESDLGQLTYLPPDIDEEDLRSFLVLFRHFIMNDEPIFIYRIFNLCDQHLNSESRKQQAAKARESWRNAMKGINGIKLSIDNEEFTPEKILAMWINGHYFHNDANYSLQLKQLKEHLPLIKSQFIAIVHELTNILLWLGDFVNYGLKQKSFSF